MGGGLGQADFGPKDAGAGEERFSFRSAAEDALGFIEIAVERIVRSESADSALRELEAFLIEILGLVERDPGLELAAEDLHRAATMILGDRCAGAETVDVRRRRLLLDAARRFRACLDAACPSRGARPRLS